MGEWLKKIVNEPSTLVAIFSSGFVGFLVGVANGIVQKKHGGWGGFMGAVATGLAVAVIVGLGLQDYVKSEAFRLAIIGVCAVISNDIWAGFLAIGRLIREDPLGGLARIIQALRGQAVATAAPGPDSRDSRDLGLHSSEPRSLSAVAGSAPVPRLRPRDPDAD
jgi:hypothetical protein